MLIDNAIFSNPFNYYVESIQSIGKVGCGTGNILQMIALSALASFITIHIACM